jgi:hypothetical protein
LSAIIVLTLKLANVLGRSSEPPKGFALVFVVCLVPCERRYRRRVPAVASADMDFLKTLTLKIEDGFEAANCELKANGKLMR